MDKVDNENIQDCYDDQEIKPINKETVHRICSGQVVLSLSIAMKELVENSIDAGATVVDIHLKEYGADLLEVFDNGSGVLPENFESLTLKHYTSKIRDYNDLQTLGTLGFRGEALSSLCALSDLVITTRHHSATVATKIIYDHGGKIISKTPVAREKGTTVTLSKLFSTLPVRRKEFTKNLKREFNKLCKLLYAYCLVSKGIKFICANTTDKGSKSTVVSTDGNNTVRENIINVFGPKQISSLIDVNQIPPSEEILTEYGIKLNPEESCLFSTEFLISSVTHGSGRSTSDRQFYFINSRPCEPSKLMKLTNEIYKQFNSNQYPFVYLNILTKSSSVDVNITPDKRQVFLEKEKLLLATIKASLLASFKQFPSTFKLQNLDIAQFMTQNKGIKRSHTEIIVHEKGSILQKFKKRSKTEKSSGRTQILKSFINTKDSLCTPKQEPFSELDIDEDILTESQEKLDHLVELACQLTNDDCKEENIIEPLKPEDLEVSLDQPMNIKQPKKSVVFNVSLDQIKKCESNENEESDESIRIKFRSEIKTEHNKSAEEELQKQIQKSDFKEMTILGQFNKGFIITKLQDDLFIIDQHASDEKYNFEQLQMNTTLDTQILVNSKPLELTAGNECLLIDNIDVFKKIGFSFKIDADAPCTKKVALTSVPISRKFVFVKADIDEMLLILQETSNTICIPSKVKKMFASRACRKSVMIGSDLSKAAMKKIMDHMGQIDQPWNCPHGRPTMRHLLNLKLLENQEN